LHVARVIELVVEPVGQANGTPLVGRQRALDEAFGPPGVAAERGAVLLVSWSHTWIGAMRVVARAAGPDSSCRIPASTVSLIGGGRSALATETPVVETMK